MFGIKREPYPPAPVGGPIEACELLDTPLDLFIAIRRLRSAAPLKLS